MSFMVGHTKLSLDCVLKQQYQHAFVSCLDDIAELVNSSGDVSEAQLIGTVVVYNRVSFLRGVFHSSPHFKIFHHFTFLAGHSDNEGVQ